MKKISNQTSQPSRVWMSLLRVTENSLENESSGVDTEWSGRQMNNVESPASLDGLTKRIRASSYTPSSMLVILNPYTEFQNDTRSCIRSASSSGAMRSV